MDAPARKRELILKYVTNRIKYRLITNTMLVREYGMLATRESKINREHPQTAEIDYEGSEIKRETAADVGFRSSAQDPRENTTTKVQTNNVSDQAIDLSKSRHVTRRSAGKRIP